MGPEIIENQLKERGQVAGQYNQFIVELLRFILSRNAFMFDFSHFLQVQGVAMGGHDVPHRMPTVSWGMGEGTIRT